MSETITVTLPEGVESPPVENPVYQVRQCESPDDWYLGEEWKWYKWIAPGRSALPLLTARPAPACKFKEGDKAAVQDYIGLRPAAVTATKWDNTQSAWKVEVSQFWWPESQLTLVPPAPPCKFTVGDRAIFCLGGERTITKVAWQESEAEWGVYYEGGWDLEQNVLPAPPAPPAKVKVKGSLDRDGWVWFSTPVAVGGEADILITASAFPKLSDVELAPGEYFRLVEVEVDAVAGQAQ